MTHPEPTLVVALALGAGVLAQVVASHLRLPSIVLLFACGVALGPDGLAWVQPAALGEGLFGLVELAVGVILFEGGLNLDVRRLRRQGVAIRGLVTVGVLVTALGGSIAAAACMGWPWRQAVLFGTLVVVSGPTVIRPILRNVPLRPRLATVVEAEAVLTDPVGAILAVLTLEAVLHATLGSVASGVVGFVLRIGFGAGAGVAFGLALAFLLRAPRLVPEDLRNVVTLGSVVAFFALCEHVLSESGILAVTLAGIVLANFGAHLTEDLREFKEALTVGFVGLLFVLLAADVRLAEVARLGRAGLATVGALVFLVRPACVLAATARSDLSGREKAFLAWMAPRGIVAAAVASVAAGFMEAQDLVGGRDLRALVFLTIALTVVVQGATAPLVARLLEVRRPARDATVILGAAELGLALGRLLREGDGRVVFVDINPAHIQTAQDEGFQCVYGNAHAERTLAQARLEQAQVAVALTPNDEVNSLFAREAHKQFDVPTTLVAIGPSESGVRPAMLAKHGSRILFDRPKDIERWNVRFRHDLVQLERYTFIGKPPAPESPEDEKEQTRRIATGAEAYLMLAYDGNAGWVPWAGDHTPKPDERATVAVYLEQADAAREGLRLEGWMPDPADAPEAAA